MRTRLDVKTRDEQCGKENYMHMGALGEFSECHGCDVASS
jgi:hypothetical protein